MTTTTTSIASFTEDEHTTEAMRVAHKQGWTLPGGTLAELRKMLDAVPAHRAPDAFFRQLGVVRNRPTPEQLTEAKRLSRNEQVNEWRRRTRIQAAMDTRSAEAKRRRVPKQQRAAEAA